MDTGARTQPSHRKKFQRNRIMRPMDTATATRNTPRMTCQTQKSTLALQPPKSS